MKWKAVSGIMLSMLLTSMFYAMSNVGMVKGWSNGGFSSDPNNPAYGTHDWIAQHVLDWCQMRKNNTFWIIWLLTYMEQNSINFLSFLWV
jgi:hypothetical protein